MKKLFFILILLIGLVGQTGNTQAFTPTDLQSSGLIVVSAPSGPDVTTSDVNWTEIPKMKTRFVMPVAGQIAVTLCGEVTVYGGNLWVRITDNGDAFSPDDVVLANGNSVISHCFTFVNNNAAAGFHVIRAEWSVGVNTDTGAIGDRTMTITFSSSASEDLVMLAVAAPSGPDVSALTYWTGIPDLSSSITLAQDSSLMVTLSGEASTDGGNRLYVRALVDGQVASASDAILITGGFSGTRSYTFAIDNVLAGTHNVSLEYSCDVDYQCYLGDRTMMVVAQAYADLRRSTGVFVAAPSGPDQTTTSSAWEDVPDANVGFFNPAESDIAVQFTAEISGDANGRIFLRALLDGVPIEPSDVLFVLGDFNGSHPYTFVYHNLSRGNHTVQMQWSVDGGTTGYIGDHTTAVWGFASQHPLLVIAMESDRGQDGYKYGGYFSDTVVDSSGQTRVFRPYVRERFFSNVDSVAGYFLENSYGNHYIVDGGLKGPYKKQYTEYYYRNSVPDPFTTMMLEAQEKADQDNFDFALYDRDGNGTITTDELANLIVFYQDCASGGFGQNGGIPNYTTNDGVILANNNMSHIYLCDFTVPFHVGHIAHEVAHMSVNSGDMYEDFWDPTRPGPFSLLDDPFKLPHMDPWHKLYADNWFEPYNITQDGYYKIPAVENYPGIYYLPDAAKAKEYFLVENRQLLGYDKYLPDTGIAIWHINENASGDWIRNGVMIEPAVGPTDPIRWEEYLYDGIGTTWGLDFWRDSSGSNSRWVDGNDSQIGVWAIPASSDEMTVYLDVPGSGILIDIKPDFTYITRGQAYTYQIRLVNTSDSAFTFALQTTLDSSWVNWSQNPIYLESYEERFITLTVTVPTSMPSGTVWFNVSAQGAAGETGITTHPWISLNAVDSITFLPLILR